MSPINPLAAKEEFDAVSEAGTIKDSNSGDEGPINQGMTILKLMRTKRKASLLMKANVLHNLRSLPCKL